MKKKFMRPGVLAGLTLGLAITGITGSGALAQTQENYTEYPVGTTLDTAEPARSEIGNEVPLPPGKWLVVSRSIASLPMSRGVQVPDVTLGLKSMDPENPIALTVVNFPARSRYRITWGNPVCAISSTESTSFVLNYGTSNQSQRYGCANGSYRNGNLRSALDNLGHHNDAAVKGIWEGFLPYLSEVGANGLWLDMHFNLDRGARANYIVLAKSRAGITPHNTFDLAARQWVQSAGETILKNLDGSSGKLDKFPDANLPADPNNAVDATWPGKVLTNGIPLESATKLPLPPGSWRVVSRSNTYRTADAGKDISQTTLVLRNIDANASMPVIAVDYDTRPYFASNTQLTCPAGNNAFVNEFGSTPTSKLYWCATGGYFKASLKQRVLNASKSSEWDKTHLGTLANQADGLPDAHIWMSLRSYPSDGRRVSYFLVGLPGPSAADMPIPFAATWLEGAKAALQAQMEGRAQSFPTYLSAAN